MGLLAEPSYVAPFSSLQMKSETSKKHLEETLMAYRCVVVPVIVMVID